MEISKSVYWTDSTITLQYIRSEDRRFHTFVANRVARIREGSYPSQWRYVNTKSNPADFASRGPKACELVDNKLWLEGPEFLKMDKSQWPEQPTIQAVPGDESEVRAQPLYAVQARTASEDNSVITKLFCRFSEFYKLKKIVAWILRAKCFLLATVRKT